VPNSPISGSAHAVGGHSSLLHIHALRAAIPKGTHMTSLKLPRRRFLYLAAGAAALPAVSRIARAQAYPSRPVRWIVGTPPGGALDAVARVIGQWLTERFGQPFVIENRPSGSYNIATDAVVRAAPDGYTLLLVATANAINATLYDKLNFNFIRDIAPIAPITREPNVMVVNPSVPVKSVPEFIAYAKSNPGKINMASSGIGTSQHVAGELFKVMAGVDLVHVPYRGGAPALTDLIGGQVQVMFAFVSSSIEFVKAAKLRALAVTTTTPLPALPDVPVVANFVPGYEASGRTGMGAPKNTPAEIINRLNQQINAAIADPKIRIRLSDLGSIAFTGSPDDLGKHVAQETEKWGRVIRGANIKLE
jgi:tripartite-type tricarboxylate transporter receptor subunit TctC